MQLILAFLAFNLFWTIGRAIATFFIAIVSGAAAYALSKYWLMPELQNFVFPLIPDYIGCAMKSVNFGSSFSLIIAAIQTRITLLTIFWANKSILG